MRRSTLAAPGLALVALFQLLAIVASLQGDQVVVAFAQLVGAVGMLVAAWAARDLWRYPHLGVLAFGFSLNAFGALLRFVVRWASDWDAVLLGSFAVFTAGALIAAAGAWRWARGLRRERARWCLWLRSGAAVMGLAVAAFVVIIGVRGDLDALRAVQFGAGLAGAIMFVAASEPPADEALS